jgi:UDP-GlcNAc:undecaprenyl-phosphate/decaprenyl-phosphate GlcNAc-1-phosphate transferase
MNFFEAAGLIELQAFGKHILFCSTLFILAIILTRIMLYSVRIMDIPNSRSSHSSPIPKSGGIAIVATFLVGVLAIYSFGDVSHIQKIYFSGFVLSSTFVAGIAFFDDVQYKSFVLKLGSQILAAGVLISFGIIIDRITIPVCSEIQLGLLAYPITLLWVVGLTNAYNFMDGIDGLAAGTAVIVCLFFGYIALSQGSRFAYINSYTILAGSLGFLVYNFPVARIFMGDVGSGFLGFTFASLAILATRYDYSHTSFLVMPLLLFNFIFDTFFTFIRRLSRGEYIAEAHRTHLYQLFNQLGNSHIKVTIFHYGVSIAQGIGAIIMVNIPGVNRLYVFIPFLLFQICYCVIIINRSRKAGLI